MRISSFALIVGVILGCHLPMVWGKAACDPKEVASTYYYKDAHLSDKGDHRGPSDRSVEKEAVQRCKEIVALFEELKSGTNLEQLDGTYQKMKAMQPPVHPADEKDSDNTFNLYLDGSGYASKGTEARALILSYLEILKLQEEAAKKSGKKSNVEWHRLAPEEKARILKQNEELGERVASSVAQIQQINQNFTASGGDIANRFKNYVEQGGQYGQANLAPESGGAVAIGAGAVGDGGAPASAPGQPSVRLDNIAPPAPGSPPGSQGPGGDKRSIPPIVPATGLVLMGAGAIGYGYEKYKQKAESNARSAKLGNTGPWAPTADVAAQSAAPPQAGSEVVPAEKPAAVTGSPLASMAPNERAVLEKTIKEYRNYLSQSGDSASFDDYMKNHVRQQQSLSGEGSLRQRLRTALSGDQPSNVEVHNKINRMLKDGTITDDFLRNGSL